jgi:hypothetical protein
MRASSQSPIREADGLSRLHNTITDWPDSGYTRRIAFVQHSLNAQRLRGFDRIHIESAGVPPEVEHAIESVGPVRPMRLDESLELVLGTGIQSFEITGKDLTGWSGWKFRGRSRQGQAQRKGTNKERENDAHVPVCAELPY